MSLPSSPSLSFSPLPFLYHYLLLQCILHTIKHSYAHLLLDDSLPPGHSPPLSLSLPLPLALLSSLRTNAPAAGALPHAYALPLAVPPLAVSAPQEALPVASAAAFPAPPSGPVRQPDALFPPYSIHKNSEVLTYINYVT